MNSILYTSPLVSNTKAGVMNADYVPVAIRQVLSNFLRNSLDAAADGGCVTLRASTQFSQKDGQRLVRIVVSDNGHGIGRSALSNLFQPFFTTRGLVGNGLGLWVSKQNIEKHGGKIQVRSRTSGPRQGTTFSVVLPKCMK